MYWDDDVKKYIINYSMTHDTWIISIQYFSFKVYFFKSQMLNSITFQIWNFFVVCSVNMWFFPNFKDDLTLRNNTNRPYRKDQQEREGADDSPCWRWSLFMRQSCDFSPITEHWSLTHSTTITIIINYHHLHHHHHHYHPHHNHHHHYQHQGR